MSKFGTWPELLRQLADDQHRANREASEDELLRRVQRLDRNLVRPLYVYRMAMAKLDDNLHDNFRAPSAKGARKTAINAAVEIEKIVHQWAEGKL